MRPTLSDFFDSSQTSHPLSALAVPLVLLFLQFALLVLVLGILQLRNCSLGQRIRMITVPSAGKALSLGGSEFITSFCFYLCTSITLPETYPI